MFKKFFALALTAGVAITCTGFSPALSDETVHVNVFYYDEDEKLQVKQREIPEYSQNSSISKITREISQNDGEIEEIIVEEPEFIPISAEKNVRDDDDYLNDMDWEANYTAINHNTANNIATGDGVIIAVVDTGVNATTDLAWKTVTPYGVFGDANGHGTAVALTAAAKKDGKVGQGIAYDALIMPVNAHTTGTGLSSALIAEGIIHAVNNGADIINMSFGGTGTSQATRKALDYAVENNVILIAASGNVGTNATTNSATTWPAAYEDVIGVANYDAKNNILNSTSIWSGVDFTMPGTGITVQSHTSSGFAYSWTGTSFAAPYLSGLAALAREIDPDITQAELYTHLKNTVGRVGTTTKNIKTGWGIPHADNFVKSVKAATTQAPVELPAQGVNAQTPNQTLNKGESFSKVYTVGSDTTVELQVKSSNAWTKVSDNFSQNKKAMVNFPTDKSGEYRVVAKATSTHKEAILDNFTITIKEPTVLQPHDTTNGQKTADSTVALNAKFEKQYTVGSDTTINVRQKINGFWQLYKSYKTSGNKALVSFPTDKESTTEYQIVAQATSTHLETVLDTFTLKVKGPKTLPDNGVKKKSGVLTIAYGNSVAKTYKTNSATNIVVQRLDGNKWVQVSSVRTSNNSAKITFTSNKIGKVAYRVIALGTSTHKETILDELTVNGTKAPSASTITVPNKSVNLRSKFNITVSTKVDTKVELWSKNSKGTWVRSSSVSTKNKRATVTIPTNAAGKFTYEIRTVATSTHNAVKATKPFNVAVNKIAQSGKVASKTVKKNKTYTFTVKSTESTKFTLQEKNSKNKWVNAKTLISKGTGSVKFTTKKNSKTTSYRVIAAETKNFKSSTFASFKVTVK